MRRKLRELFITDQGHALVGEGNQHIIDAVSAAQQLTGLADCLLFIGIDAGRIQGFNPVGFDQPGACIFCVIAPLGINQHPDAVAAAQLDGLLSK